MFRKFSPLASLAIAGLVLTGCTTAGDDDAETSDVDAKITVVLNDNPTGNALANLVEEYRAATNRDVQVTLLAEQQMRDRIQLNLQSRSDAMDVYMTLPNREGALYAASGYYVPLDDFLASSSADYDAEGLAPAALTAMSVDGVVEALPLNVEGPVMYYRTDVFKELGLAVPTTIDELFDVVETIQQKRPDLVPITARGNADAMAYTFGPFFHADGLEWTTDGEPNFDDPRAVEAIEQYATLMRDFGPPGVVNYSFNESTNLFASGGAAIELESSNLFPTIMNATTSSVVDTTGVANMPGGVPTISAWGIAMSPFSKNQDAAWAFMEWATSPEVHTKLALAGSAAPRDSVFADTAYQSAKLSTPAEKAWGDALQYIFTHGNPEVGPVGFQAPQMRSVIGNGVGTVILKSATAKEAAKAIQDGLAPLLAR